METKTPRGQTRYMTAIDAAPFQDVSPRNNRQHEALRSLTAIILDEPVDANTGSPVRVMRDTVIVSNSSSDYWRLRGYSINKIVLVGLVEAQINSNLKQALEASTQAAQARLGHSVKYIEV